MKHTQLMKIGDHHYKGCCPICAEETEFREPSFGQFAWLFVRAVVVLVAKPWNAVHSEGASNGIAQNLSCDRCKTYIEVCPLCLAAWRGTMSADGVKCPGCESQLGWARPNMPVGNYAPNQEKPMTIGEFIRKISVPLGYVQDQLTNGPVLPDGWTGDAWQAQDQGRGYFLRAWNDTTGQVATIQSETSYEEAARRLRQKIQDGGDWTATAEERS